MAQHETNWILKLVDELTKPLRDATKVTKETKDVVDSVTASLDDMDATTREMAKRSLKSFGDLTNEIEKEEKEIKKLEQRIKDAGDAIDPLQKAQIDFKIDRAQTKVRRYQEQLVEINHELSELEKGPDAAQLEANWGAAVVVANQTVELVNRAIGALNFTVDIEALRTGIQRMTGESGDALDDLTSRAFKLGKVFKENPEEIAKAANAMTKQIGGTYAENLELIESGFEKGANINGDFLDQLKEFPAFIKQVGLSQSQSIALISQAGQKAIFSDKAIDSIKEADLSLREMGKTQIDALRGIGLEASDIAGKTTFEAVQMISSSMEGATTQAKQLVLADIFKGAGEDAGLAWIEGLGSIDLDINKIPSVEGAGSSIRGWLADMQTTFSNAFGSMGATVVELSPVVTAVAGMIPLVSSLTTALKAKSVADRIATASQWALNIAMDANPIGLVIIAIAALVTMIVGLVAYYDEWGASMTMLLGPLGYIINLIQSFRRHWDSITDAFENGGIIAGIKRIGLVIFDAILMPMEQLMGILSNIPGLGKLATLGKEAINNARRNLDLNESEEVTATAKDEIYKVDTVGGNTPTIDPVSPLNKNQVSGSGSGGKILNMTLEVVNNFNVKSGADLISRKDEIIDMIVGGINDKMKDSLIAVGI